MPQVCPWLPAVPPVLAYLDPGSGSLLVQGLLGGSAALVVALRLAWGYLRGLLGARPAEPEEGAG